jgi:hypothetical protein
MLIVFGVVSLLLSALVLRINTRYIREA